MSFFAFFHLCSKKYLRDQAEVSSSSFHSLTFGRNFVLFIIGGLYSGGCLYWDFTVCEKYNHFTLYSLDMEMHMIIYNSLCLFNL